MAAEGGGGERRRRHARWEARQRRVGNEVRCGERGGCFGEDFLVVRVQSRGVVVCRRLVSYRPFDHEKHHGK